MHGLIITIILLFEGIAPLFLGVLILNYYFAEDAGKSINIYQEISPIREDT